MPSFHLSQAGFRRRGKQLLNWIAGYHQRIEKFPVLSRAKPGEIRAAFPPSPPQQGEPFEAILKDLDEKLLPGITHWQSPNFYAFFPCNASGPGILGDLLSSGLGVQGMLWATSPACTELEQLMLDWLVEMLDLPKQFLSTGPGGGVIQDSASSASLCAILAARERATNFAANAEGCRQPLVAYASTQAHSSIEKDIKAAGIGSRNLRLIETDAALVMRPELLEQAIEKDKRAGLVPFFVCATVGTTSTMAFDPLVAIGEICRRHQLWLHVDAAMAGAAALCPEFRGMHDGLHFADSYIFNPHKWMFTNFDCNCFYVADRRALTEALSVTPEYLRNQASAAGMVTDFRDWQVPLGRRFRALKLWFVIRHYGVEGLQYHIRRHVELARMFTAWLEKDKRFEIAAPPQLNLVCFRLKPRRSAEAIRESDAANQELLNHLNQSGELYLSHTKVNGKFTLRMCIGQTHTEERHIRKAWRAIRREAATILGANRAHLKPAITSD